ncbi:formylglycine-generating enzyme family protein [Myxococcota bacterium]|nr:formylglycine-generating enzyme family protein [Myxococcota bacterium]
MTRRIFLSYDARIPNARDIIRDLRANSRLSQIQFAAVLSDDPAGDALAELLGAKIRDCDGLLAFVDRANAFVGWELGVALAAGRPVALSLCQSDAPRWLQEGPLQERVRNGRGLAPNRVRELALTHQEWRPSPGPARKGLRAVVLCPGDDLWTDLQADVKQALPDVQVLDIRACPLDALAQHLADVGHCAWVIPEDAPPDDAPHSDETAWLAIVAGYLHQGGVPVTLLRKDRALRMSCLPCHTPWTRSDELLDQLRAWAADAAGLAPPPVDPATAFRARQHLDHRPRFPWLRRGVGAPLDLVPVELEMVEGADPDCMDVGRSVPHGPPASILDLLSPARCRPGPDGRAPRWLVAAEPGAGKTTMLRWAVHRICAPDSGDARLPVLLALAGAEGARDPLQAAAGEDEALLATLRAAAAEGRLLLLLDGYDEVREPSAVYRRLQSWAATPALAHVPMLVTARPVAVDAEGWPGFVRARINYLDPGRQRELVKHVLVEDEDCKDFWAQADRLSGFAVLARNPFLLTLAAVLLVRGEAGQAPIRSRAELLSRAIDDCLRRGWGAGEGDETGGGVVSPGAARELLAPLSLALQRAGGEAWKRAEVEQHARSLLGQPALARYFPGYWRSDADLLDDLHHHAGLIGPLDGLGGRWRYLHRSFRELLAAEALVADPGREQIVDELVTEEQERRKAGRETGPARSGEVVALMAALLGEQGRSWLERLSGSAPELVARALPTCDWMDGWERVRRLVELEEGWDNDSLDAVVDSLAEVDHASLWEAAATERSRFRLGVLWYTLERRKDGDWPRFLAVSGLGELVRPTLDLVPVPTTEGWVGSPEGVGDPDEHPRHRVRFSRPYTLGRTPVTAGQYAAFDAERGRDDPADMPVTRVTWFEARLFAAWAGGRLPTEAEWEVACRAGTQGQWWFGDDARELPQHAATEAPEPVGRQGRSNPWGLSDLHGNVWEWTECRAYRTYTKDAADDPSGPPAGGGRVVRGGSAWGVAGGARSACRDGGRPGVRDVDVGFRVALPSEG